MFRTRGIIVFILTVGLVSFLIGCGGGNSSGGGNGGVGLSPSPPPPPTGLAAVAGDQQVALTWNASTSATSYHVKRGTVSGGPYTQVGAPTGTVYGDTGLTDNTTYYYMVTAVNSAGESGNSNEVSAIPIAPVAGGVPTAPTALAAVGGNQQVALTWSASTGATGYNVLRATVHGGPYTKTATTSGTSYTDTGLTNGTTYYYVVVAINTSGVSANSAEAFATPTAGSSSASVHVTVDVLANRHAISPYVYGVNFPSNTAYVTDSGATFVRWGGNASTRYNWLNFNTNAAADWYFQNRAMGNAPLYADSQQFVSNIAGAGAAPIMTIGMLPWVAKDASGYSFSVAKYHYTACKTNPYLPDDGNGVLFSPTCTTDQNPPVYTGNDPSDANMPLLDTGTASGSVYRDAWVQALATKYGAQPHFYDMDNEMDIWGGTHRDVHPDPTTYDELRDTYISEARMMTTWDNKAVRFGPVSCCWWFYWNSAAGGSDKTAHASIDFLPWWFNEVAFEDKRDATRSLDVFDYHAYPTGDMPNYTQAQKQALALRVTRDFWDPSYISEDTGNINQQYATYTQPNKTIAFRIPRLRALVNSIFKDVYSTPPPLSMTEWNAALAGETDFSTALVDADVFGILGRERMFAASRWTAADSTAPAYQALKLYRNYDGAHHTFAPISVSATNDATDPGLFSGYAAINAAGTTLTVLVINKSPSATVSTAINLNHFTAATATTYTLWSGSPTSIVAGTSGAFQGTYSFAPYSATLLVITGTMAQSPAVEWDLNPDTTMVPAGGSVTLAPKVISGTGTVTLNSQQSDAGINVVLTQPSVTATQNGTVTVTATATPGFYHYTVTGTDNSGTQQTQGGWIVVGNPAASLTKGGDAQTGSSLTLTAALNVGSSGATPPGASILFTTTGGTLSSRIVTTDSSGNATVTLTLPSGTGKVTVTAEGPWPLGHPVATFTETSN
jgi:fibronectin type 3 domain-containing protein